MESYNNEKLTISQMELHKTIAQLHDDIAKMVFNCKSQQQIDQLLLD